jgi:hypothetical protein
LDAALSALLDELAQFCNASNFPDDVCVVAAELEGDSGSQGDTQGEAR